MAETLYRLLAQLEKLRHFQNPVHNGFKSNKAFP